MAEITNKYKLRHLKVFQNGIKIIDRDIFVLVDSSPYFRDRNMRSITYKETLDDKSTRVMSFGVTDTFIIS